MKGYLSIGKVAKLKGVSIKSLRYYDEIGVFRPAYTDPVTNYRYYKEEQLPLLDAVSLCIELGIALRDFDKYRDETGTFRFRDLLYDGKLMAEQKIMDIRKRLETVQVALDTVEKTAQEARSFHASHLEKRAVLTAPYNPSEDNYSQKILRLFMLAQLLGMKAEYPAGLLYEYSEDGTVERFIFVHITGEADITDKRVRILPAGEYNCRKETTRVIDKGAYINELSLRGKHFLAIESDILEPDQNGHTVELQILVD
ncbi:MAG: MerR family DNA-binding transcriptional regulator [Lachnospiraceae bacterium]|nr:MerR family DNA-binding transcriptional regulator [Lachnospiraceae bacterium]